MNNRITGTLLFTASLALAGCDPGMIIRQVEDAQTSDPGVVIHVAKDYPFISENWYAPAAKITNSTGGPINVASVELVTAGRTYQNKPLGDSYPFLLAAGETASLDTWFDLATTDVYEAFPFHSYVRLRIHYRIGKEERAVDATMVGLPLSSEPSEPKPCSTMSRC